MRFRRRHRQPPYFNRKDQMRLLRLVGLLVLVLIAVKVAGDPDFWAWMFPDRAEETANQDADEPRFEDIDFSVRPEEEEPPELQPGEFLSQPPRKMVEGGQAGRQDDASVPLDIDPQILAPIQDSTLRIRHDEAEAYYTVLSKVRDLPADRMRQAAEKNVGFTVLMTHPGHYRGKLLTVRGEVKRLLPFTAGENSYGFRDLWEAWLLTPDSHQHPYRVVCLEIPEGIPRGEQIDEPVPVSVTGYFFKIEGYASKAGLQTAPLILAKRLRWFPPPPAGPDSPGAGAAPWIVGLVCLIAGSLALMLWWFSLSDRAVRTRHIRRLSEPPQEAIDALRDVEAVEPDAAFRKMTEPAPPEDQGGREAG